MPTALGLEVVTYRTVWKSVWLEELPVVSVELLRFF